MKKGKIFLIGLSIIFLMFIIWQGYGIYIHKGNLSFTICNESGIDSLNIEIFIDGEKKFDDKLQILYGFYSMKISPNNHEAIIKINGDVSQKIKFNTVLFTNIYVDYHSDRGYKEQETRFNVSISKCPIQFLM